MSKLLVARSGWDRNRRVSGMGIKGPHQDTGGDGDVLYLDCVSVVSC